MKVHTLHLVIHLIHIMLKAGTKLEGIGKMGEAKRRRIFQEARMKSLSAQTEAEMVDTTSIPGMVIKRHPEEIGRFREELALPHNKDLYDAGMRGETFEECIAEIAAGLHIKMDGDYHPLI